MARDTLIQLLLNMRDSSSDQRRAFNEARKKYTIKHQPYGLSVQGYNLKGLNLQGINFGHADLNEANFEGANLRHAKFDYTSASRTCFRNADLKGVNGLYKFSGFYGPDFEDADLRGALFRPFPDDSRYDHNIRFLLNGARFKETKITPEQRDQLVELYEIPLSSIENNFIVSPRGRYPNGPLQVILERSIDLYNDAKASNRVFKEQFNGQELEYAIVPVKGNEDIKNMKGYAFSFVQISATTVSFVGSAHARYLGNWSYFVFDCVPEQFREFAAVHEFGEREGGSHEEATIIEYERARSKGMLNEYLSWISSAFPGILVRDLIYVFTDDKIHRLPSEAQEAARKLMPTNIENWKEQQENRQYGLPVDIWNLAWKGLQDHEIHECLVQKNYDFTPEQVEYWKEQMEIPQWEKIKELTYVKPY
jgi:hypothetical protein